MTAFRLLHEDRKPRSQSVSWFALWVCLTCNSALLKAWAADPVSFRNQVQPILSRFGCNSGACHGAAAGQGGFKLSLRGYDDDGDYLALTRQALGRRVSPAEPERSLLLLKPTGAVPHKGGVKFDANSVEYQRLARWIAQGAPRPSENDPRIESIEILPARTVSSVGSKQPIQVRARFSNGNTEDVTPWAKFSSSVEAVANVSEGGVISVVGPGEGAVTAWYLSKLSTAFITVPFTNEVETQSFEVQAPRNFVDELVLRKLRDLRLVPAALCSDSEFIRRAYLDTVGVLPKPDEVRAFLSNSNSDKRDVLIETLLKRDEFVDYWAYKWSDLLLVQSKRLRPAAMWSFYSWIREQVALNTPWDVLARKLIMAQGSTLENGAANFYILHNEPKLAAENVSQAFLGMSINCARCHNHPLEKWTNDQYFGFANLFARIRSKSGAVDGESHVFVVSDGDLIQPLKGRPQTPRALEGPGPDRAQALDRDHDRRAVVADWVASSSNAYFARAIANRIWANFFGVGLVEKVDDLRLSNPASNEALLDALAQALAEKKFDLKSLMRTILQSQTYQRSSIASLSNAADARYYSRYYPRRLMAEVLLDAISQVTGVPTRFGAYPEGWRALQLPDSNVDSYFLKSFGRADRDRTCECERTADPSVAQVLHLSNGDLLNQKLSAKGGRIDSDLGAGLDFERLVESAYLSAYARFPAAKEKESLVRTLAEASSEDRRPVLEDIYWALLTSKEFLFNH